MVTSVGGAQPMGGTVGSGCDFFGFDLAGIRTSLYPERLKRIDFKRE
jgi:hypothetical protein